MAVSITISITITITLPITVTLSVSVSVSGSLWLSISGAVGSVVGWAGLECVVVDEASLLAVMVRAEAAMVWAGHRGGWLASLYQVESNRLEASSDSSGACACVSLLCVPSV